MATDSKFKWPLIYICIGAAIPLIIFLATCKHDVTPGVTTVKEDRKQVTEIVDTFRNKFLRSDSVNILLKARDTFNRQNLADMQKRARYFESILVKSEQKPESSISNEKPSDYYNDSNLTSLIINGVERDSICNEAIQNLSFRLQNRDSTITDRDSLNNKLLVKIDSLIRDKDVLITANDKQKHKAKLTNILWKGLTVVLSALLLKAHIR